MRLLLDTLEQVVVVPTVGGAARPEGTFVYVVGSDDESVAVRPVRSASRTTKLAVITKGLQPGERVVTTGFAPPEGWRRGEGRARRRSRNRAAGRQARRRRMPARRAGDTPRSTRRRRPPCKATAPRAAGKRGEGAAVTADAGARSGQPGRRPMSVSAPFITRPIATSLLAFAAVIGGWLGYFWLPVSSLPQVDFPTIQVSTQLPGANPQTMSTLVTASLEREFGQIPALTTMTSTSAYGLSQITLQFDLGRDIDAAAQDVQSAINAAGSTLPRNLPYPPTYAKVNPADAPIVTLALTSDIVSMRDSSDLADTLHRPAPRDGNGRRPRLGRGRHPPGRAHPGGRRPPRLLRPIASPTSQRHLERQRRRPEGLAGWHAPELHHRRQRPDRLGRGLSRDRRRLPQLARRCASKTWPT